MRKFFDGTNCILGLSPMDDVTNNPFRRLCREMGADMVITEFISAEGINHAAEKSKRKMDFEERQRPVGIQIFGANEEELLKCVEVVEERHPDFIDLNWGCPVRKVAGKGAGSGALQEPERLLRTTAAVVKRAKVPVTVKTRLGYDERHKIIVELAEALQDVGVAMLSIHGRTKTQMYGGEADWTLIGEVKNNPHMKIPILGNGDLTEAEQVVEKWKRYGVDGVLIGRGAVGNPWIFEQSRRLLDGKEKRIIGIEERKSVCMRHLRELVESDGERVGLIEMKRHYAGYFKGLKGVRETRIRLMEAKTEAEARNIIETATLEKI